MKYIVYQTTNLVNGKIYIGCHQTTNVDDSYLGSGRLLLKAISKYGPQQFRKEILKEFTTRQQMLDFEKELVTAEFVKRSDTYNLKVGGEGGWDYLNQGQGRHLNSRYDREKQMTKSLKSRFSNLSPESQARFRSYDRNHSKAIATKIESYGNTNNGGFKGRTHTDDARAKIKASRDFMGEKNSQFGTKWICNPLTGCAKKVKVEEFEMAINEGWLPGRILK